MDTRENDNENENDDDDDDEKGEMAETKLVGLDDGDDDEKFLDDIMLIFEHESVGGKFFYLMNGNTLEDVLHSNKHRHVEILTKINERVRFAKC